MTRMVEATPSYLSRLDLLPVPCSAASNAGMSRASDGEGKKNTTRYEVSAGRAILPRMVMVRYV